MRLATLRREAFTAHKAEKAHGAWRAVADLARATHPKLAEAMDEAENDALAYMDSVEAFAEIAVGDDADKFALAQPAAAPILTPRAA